MNLMKSLILFTLIFLSLTSCQTTQISDDPDLHKYQDIELGFTRHKVESTLGKAVAEDAEYYYYLEYDQKRLAPNGLPLHYYSINDFFIGRIKLRYDKSQRVNYKSFTDYTGGFRTSYIRCNL